jgi:HEAT repeat protein
MGSSQEPTVLIDPILLMPKADDAVTELRARIRDAVFAAAPQLARAFEPHPLAEHIREGAKALPLLFERFEREPDEKARALIVDAIAAIAGVEKPSHDVCDRLRAILVSSQSRLIASVAARALAVAGDESFLELQRGLLHSDSPTRRMLAARLIGHGRYARALPDLMVSVRPDRATLVDAAVWAIGEIGSKEALPLLNAMIESRFFSVDALDAIARIGSVESLSVIRPLLAQGTIEERVHTVHAIARILEKRPSLPEGDRAELAKILLDVLDRGERVIMRYYALVALGRLGERVDQNRAFGALGAALPDSKLDPMSAFYKRGSPKTR